MSVKSNLNREPPLIIPCSPFFLTANYTVDNLFSLCLLTVEAIIPPAAKISDVSIAPTLAGQKRTFVEYPSGTGKACVKFKKNG